MNEITADMMPTDDLRLLAKTVGVDVAVELVKKLPGTQVRVPKKYSEESNHISLMIRNDVSVEAIEKLVDGYGGFTFYIPKSAKARVFADEIREKVIGSNVNDLAIEYGCTRQFIYDLLHEKNNKKQPKQPSLFDGW